MRVAKWDVIDHGVMLAGTTPSSTRAPGEPQAHDYATAPGDTPQEALDGAVAALEAKGWDFGDDRPHIEDGELQTVLSAIRQGDEEVMLGRGSSEDRRSAAIGDCDLYHYLTLMVTEEVPFGLYTETPEELGHHYPCLQQNEEAL